MGPSTTLDLTAEIVALHVMGRAMPQIELTLLIQAVHETLERLIFSPDDAAERQGSSVLGLKGAPPRRNRRPHLHRNSCDGAGRAREIARRAQFARRPMKGKRRRLI